MATFTKELLSGSTDGKSITVAATASPGTIIHTAHATASDEVWLYFTNTQASTRDLVVEWGGTSPGDRHQIRLDKIGPGPILVIPGWMLENSQVIRAYADATGVLCTGYLNRITP